MSPAERRDYTEHLITEKEVMDQIKLKYKAAQTKFQALLKLHGKKAIEFLAQFLHPEVRLEDAAPLLVVAAEDSPTSKYDIPLFRVHAPDDEKYLFLAPFHLHTILGDGELRAKKTSELIPVAGERGVSNEDIADAVDGETPKEALLTLIEENVPDPTEHPVLSAYCALCDAANIKPTTATLALFMHELIALCKFEVPAKGKDKTLATVKWGELNPASKYKDAIAEGEAFMASKACVVGATDQRVVDAIKGLKQSKKKAKKPKKAKETATV